MPDVDMPNTAWLGTPVTVGSGSALGSWSKPFSTRDPLFIGAFQRQSQFPGAVDVHFNVGDQVNEAPVKGAVTRVYSISVRTLETSD